LILTTVCFLAGCAHQAAKDDTTPRHYYAAGVIEPTAGQRSELLLRALGLIGVQYSYGGNSPDAGFDCSGLVHYVFSHAVGLTLPRNVEEISRVGEQIQRDELEPGDLVFFNTLRRPFSHVGIYLGEQRFIHAPSSGGQVEIVKMTERYWQRRYNGARRISL
jgi:cell wall-associated NlpC family hydrolase